MIAVKKRASQARRIAIQKTRSFARALTPSFVQAAIHKRRFLFLYESFFDNKLDKDIKASKYVTEARITEVMRRHGMRSRWAGVSTVLNDKPSKDYLSEGFFFSRIVPRMNNLEFVRAYTDKNFYDMTPMAQYTPPVVLRKIAGHYFDANYNVVRAEDIESILKGAGGDLVVKPAIESGAGRDVWIGSAADAYDEFMSRASCRDIVVQNRMIGEASFQEINPTSFNSLRLMTVFTGSQYVVLGSALRIGQKGSKVDNQSAGGVAVGVLDDGSLDYYAADKYFNKYETHPDTGFVFRGKKLPHYDRIKQACLDLHRYFPHFGIISWDVAMDNQNKVRVIELNLDLVAFGLVQVPHGPLFGPYKDEIKKTYNLPDWEK